MRKIYLVAAPRTLNGVLETWFFQNEILGGMPFTLDVGAERISNAVVIFMELHGLTIDVEFIRRLKSNGNRVVFFDIGDELGQKDITAYSECDLILRNYLYLNIFEDERYRNKILWIPNGFRTGVGPRNPAHLKPVMDRNWLAAFMGWLNNERSHNTERQIFKKIAPECGDNLLLKESDKWAGGYNLGLYSTIMESSLFAPCPAGNCPDSIRIYDALELGAIPIYLRHTFLDNRYSMESPPFPILDSWEQLPEFLANKRKEFNEDYRPFKELQTATISWWTETKKRISGNVQERLLSLRNT
jgi:hypothetical protein